MRKTRALVVAGEGLGNVVMATPVAVAANQLGFKTTLGLTYKAHRWLPAFTGHPEIEVVGVGSTGDILPDSDLVLKTVWSAGPRPADSSKVFHAKWGVDRNVHETDANMEAARKIGWTGPTPRPFVSPGELREGKLENYWVLLTACNPSEEWSRKRWKGWAELARILPGKCVFLGGDSDSRGWMQQVGLNLCGRIPLDEALAWIAGARVAVGIDCGLAHCAAAIGVPVVVLFGPTSDRKNRPLGSSVRLLRRSVGCAPCQFSDDWSICHEYACMYHDPAEVREVVLKEAEAWGR